ncbi:MAG: glycoside hydrolase family 88 protein, partial [Chitinispirillaceae bacterium]|nr:glycoside hydrolase family 88 protein [Chitinispirillaceae bacterium]
IKYLNFFADYLVTYMKNLQQENGLYWHHKDLAHQFWGRGNGWGAASTSELIQVLPKEHPKYNDVITGYKKQMKGLIDVQLKNGMWQQLLGSTSSKNWEETSGTSMFIFALFPGLELGILDKETYLEPAKKGWMAVIRYLSNDGKLSNVAEGFWPKVGDENEYLNAPKASPGNSHGTAGFLWAATAIVRYYKKVTASNEYIKLVPPYISSYSTKTHYFDLKGRLQVFSLENNLYSLPREIIMRRSDGSSSLFTTITY